MLNDNITGHVTCPSTFYTVNHKRTHSMDWRASTAKKERKIDRMNERRTPSMVCVCIYVYIYISYDCATLVLWMFKRPIGKKKQGRLHSFCNSDQLFRREHCQVSWGFFGKFFGCSTPSKKRGVLADKNSFASCQQCRHSIEWFEWR